MISYLKRFFDATDNGADLLSLGAFLGFMVFVAGLFMFLLVFTVHSFHPAVLWEPRGFAESMAGLGVMYASVLGATIGAFRLRGPLSQPTSAGGEK